MITLEQLIEELAAHPQLNITISHSTGSRITFESWAWQWAKYYKEGKVKDNTYYDSIERQLRLHLIPRFGKCYLDEILPVDVHKYFSELEDKYSIETQHKIKVCLHALYDAAIENQLCDRNPVTSSLKLVSKIPQKEKRIWTQQQYCTAWNFAKNHPQGLTIMVLMETGMIRSEMLGLVFDNYDSENSCLHIRNGLVPAKRRSSGKTQVIHEGLKTAYRKREIPISPTLNAHLNAIPRKIMIGGNKKLGTSPHSVRPTFLFYSPSGKAWNPSNWYHRCFLPFMRDLHTAHPDIPPLSPHELRHTRASLLQDRGVDLYDIQVLLGHKDLTMLSRRYLHTDVDRLRQKLHLDSEN